MCEASDFVFCVTVLHRLETARMSIIVLHLRPSEFMLQIDGARFGEQNDVRFCSMHRLSG